MSIFHFIFLFQFILHEPHEAKSITNDAKTHDSREPRKMYKNKQRTFAIGLRTPRKKNSNRIRLHIANENNDNVKTSTYCRTYRAHCKHNGRHTIHQINRIFEMAVGAISPWFGFFSAIDFQDCFFGSFPRKFAERSEPRTRPARHGC